MLRWTVRLGMVAAIVGLAAVHTAQLSTQAAAAPVTVAISPSSGIPVDAKVTVRVSDVTGGRIAVAQCVLHETVPTERSCRNAVTAPVQPDGTATVTVPMHPRIGSLPETTCLTPGACVLRVVHQPDVVAIASVAGQSDGEGEPPPEGQQLSQDIRVTLIDPSAPPPDPEPEPRPDQPPEPDGPEVGGETVTPPLVVTPLDGPGVRGEVVTRDQMPVTGISATTALALTILGLVLIDFGFAAMTASRRRVTSTLG